MRTLAKSTLKAHLLKDVHVSESEGIEHIIVDGGPFIWCCNWKKGDLFRDIAAKYVTEANELHVDLIVFDGNEKSAKNETQGKRKKNVIYCSSDRGWYPVYFRPHILYQQLCK